MPSKEKTKKKEKKKRVTGLSGLTTKEKILAGLGGVVSAGLAYFVLDRAGAQEALENYFNPLTPQQQLQEELTFLMPYEPGGARPIGEGTRRGLRLAELIWAHRLMQIPHFARQIRY